MSHVNSIGGKVWTFPPPPTHPCPECNAQGGWPTSMEVDGRIVGAWACCPHCDGGYLASPASASPDASAKPGASSASTEADR